MSSAVALTAVEDTEAEYARAETASATRAAGLLTVAGLAVGAANLLFNVVVARSGGIAAYGGIGALLALVTGGGFLAVGLQYAVARRAATTPAEPRVLLRSVARRAAPWSVTGLVAIAAAPAIASFLHLASALPAMTAVALIGVGLALAVPVGILIGHRRFGAVALVMLLPAIVRLVLAAPLGHLGDPILGALVASGVPMFAAFIGAVLLIFRSTARPNTPAPLHTVSEGDPGRGVVADGIVGALLATTIWTVWSLPLAFGRHHLGPSQASDLAVAQLVAGGVILVAGTVVTAFFPSIVRGRTTSTLFAGLLVTLALALAGAAVMVVLLPELTPRFYGAEFATPASLVAALSASLLAVAVANYLLWAARALQRLLVPTSVGCGLALLVEVGLGAGWHPAATILALEPGLALLLGLGAGGATALAQRLRRPPSALAASLVVQGASASDGLARP